MTDQIAGPENVRHEIEGHENTGHDIATHDKCRMKIYYITVQCAFLLNFKSFVCSASVLTWRSLICIQSTVENCLQLLQILIVSLLPLHINIVGVVTCSDNCTRRLLTCIIGSFFQFISLSHYTVPLLQRQNHQNHNTRKN